MHAVIIHYSKVSCFECLSHRFWDFRFSFDHFGAGILCLGNHFLFKSHGHRTSFFSFGLCNVFIGICLVHLEHSSNIFTNINICNVNGEYFESSPAVQTFLPRLLGAFRRDYPDIHIELETGYAADALAMLDQGVVDLTVAALPERVPAGLVSRVIVVTPLIFVAPAIECEASELARRRPLPWSEVPLILPASGLVRSAVDRWCQRRRFQPRVYGEVAGHEALLSLVSLGCGLGVVPRIVAERSPLRSELTLLDIEPRIGDLRVGVCSERASLKKNRIVRAFWSSLDEAG